MKIYIIRHGETDWNVERKIQGHVDVPLNETGREQAQKIAKRLKTVSIDAIFTSDLIRAKETAQIISQHHPQSEFIIEPVFREINFGILEGLTTQEVIKLYPEFEKPKSDHDFFIRRPPKGESIEDKILQILPILEKLKKKYKNKTILISTHGGTKRAILIALKVLSSDYHNHIKFGNTALSIIKPFDIEQIELINDTSHLN